MARFHRILALVMVLVLVAITGAGCHLGGKAKGDVQAENTKVSQPNPGQDVAGNSGQTDAGKADTVKPTQAATAQAETGNLGQITTGDSITVSTTEVPTDGAMISIDKPGDPLNGFVLDVASGSYASSTPFTISYAPITAQTFGDVITPISPLITVDNGGEFSQEPMYVRVPVQVPDGYLAMGFFYDDRTGNIASMPLSSFDSESVTVSTMHFSSFFISMIQKVLLEREFRSGFTPGVDDWQFVNYGSYVAPDGHCAGQSATALWYYLTKPDGHDAHLNGRYDNNGVEPKTPALWQDDSVGYRFCSVVQHDYDTAINTIDSPDEKWLELSGVAFKLALVNGKTTWEKSAVPGLGDEIIRYLFAYGILATAQPQIVAIYSNAGGGHAMLVYRVDQEYLYIADPNYPGNTERRIAFANAAFAPYQSGANRAEIDKGISKDYEKIAFYPVTAMLPAGKIAGRWASVKDGTIGDDLFPSFDIQYKGSKGDREKLTDKVISDHRLFHIYLISPSALKYRIFRNGEWLRLDQNSDFSLVPGANSLGIYVTGIVGGDDEYVNFRHFDVAYHGLAITPDPLAGETGKEYAFTATMEDKAENVHYEWSVNNELKDTGAEPTFTYTFPAKGSYTVSVVAASGNNELGKDDARVTITDPATMTIKPESLNGELNKEYVFEAALENAPAGAIDYTWYVDDVQQQSTTSPTIKLTFTQVGDFTVSVKASAAGKELVRADAQVTITKPAEVVNNLAILQQYGFFEAGLYTRAVVHYLDKYSTPPESDVEENTGFWTQSTPIIWDGVNFTGSRDDPDTAGNKASQTIEGTVSADGNTILTLSCQLKTEGVEQTTSVAMTLQNIPLKYVNGMLDKTVLTSSDIQKNVVALENTFTHTNKGAVYASSTYISPIWTNDSSLEAIFRKTLNP